LKIYKNEVLLPTNSFCQNFEEIVNLRHIKESTLTDLAKKVKRKYGYSLGRFLRGDCSIPGSSSRRRSWLCIIWFSAKKVL